MRRLRTTLGEVRLTGIYWKCPHCGLCGHSAEAVAGATLSRLMRGLTCLLGASLASFQKAELVAHRVLGVRIDDETIRQQCLAEGHAVAREADEPPEPVAEDEPLIGSCDGTMVHTRETQWREVKGYRFEHEGGRYGGAYLERVNTFAPRLAQAAQRLGAERTAQKVFLSDMAEWITQAVPRHLPGWKHIADYWHACEHFTGPAEQLYGKHEPRAAKWAAYMGRRLRWYGAAKLADRLRDLALHYRELDKPRGAGSGAVPGQARAANGLPGVRRGGTADRQWADGALLQADRGTDEGPGHALVHPERAAHGDAGQPLEPGAGAFCGADA